MTNIEEIAKRIAETTNVHEQPFSQQETHAPHVVHACLAQLRNVRYDTLEQFYALMTTLADGYRLVGNTTKARYYINHKLTASAPHTVTHTEALLQRAAIDEHAGCYDEAYAMLMKAQRHIAQYGHVQCETVLLTQLVRCSLLLHRYDDADRYVRALRNETNAFTHAHVS